MGPSETAIALPGALEKLTFSTGTGRHRVQIAHFFRMQIGSWRPLGVGLVVGKRLYRIRQRLGSPESSESQTWGNLALARCLAERIAQYVSIDGSARACAVGACT